MAVTAKANAERIRAASALRRCPFAKRLSSRSKKKRSLPDQRYPAQGKKQVASELLFVLSYTSRICKGNAQDLIWNRCNCPQGIGWQNVIVFPNYSLSFRNVCGDPWIQAAARDSPRWRTNFTRYRRAMPHRILGLASHMRRHSFCGPSLRWPRTQTPGAHLRGAETSRRFYPRSFSHWNHLPHTFSIRVRRTPPEKEFHFHKNSE